MKRYADNAGSDGFNPEVLKFGWPGTIIDKIDQAYNGSYHTDPYGKLYFIGSFSQNSSACPDDNSILFPAVVKPPMLAEIETPAIRDSLEKIAEEAKNIRGHYRFYAYTDGAIVGNLAFRAAAGTWANPLHRKGPSALS